MMDYLKSLLILGKVLDRGSLSAVAKELDISPSAVSQHLRQLENHYQVKLLNRTTRRISPTPAGNILWQGASAISQQLAHTQQQLEQLQHEFSGEVRISLPTDFLKSLAIQHFIRQIQQNYPLIQLHLQPQDTLVDLMGNETDIAIRVSEPAPDSQLIARYLTHWQLGIYASPDYLAQNPIQNVTDLTAQRWIKFNDHVFNATFNQLSLGNFTVKNLLVCPSIVAARMLATQHQGLTLLLAGAAESDVAEGKLTPVLPDLALPQYNIYAVTAYRAQSAKISRVLAILKSCFE